MLHELLIVPAAITSIRGHVAGKRDGRQDRERRAEIPDDVGPNVDEVHWRGRQCGVKRKQTNNASRRATGQMVNVVTCCLRSSAKTPSASPGWPHGDRSIREILRRETRLKNAIGPPLSLSVSHRSLQATAIFTSVASSPPSCVSAIDRRFELDRHANCDKYSCSRWAIAHDEPPVLVLSLENIRARKTSCCAHPLMLGRPAFSHMRDYLSSKYASGHACLPGAFHMRMCFI